ncbi:MAG TPA: hypothetical protein VF502_10515 [Stellaceae bacterium]
MDHAAAVPHHFRLHGSAPTHEARAKPERLFTANGAPNHTSSNGVCLPLGYPQVACPTCDGNNGTPGQTPAINNPVAISDRANTAPPLSPP